MNLLSNLHLAGLRLHLVRVAHDHAALRLPHLHLWLARNSKLAHWRLLYKNDVGHDVADFVTCLLNKSDLASIAHIMRLGQLLKGKGSATEHLIAKVGLLEGLKNDASVMVRSKFDLNRDLLESRLITGSINDLGGVLEIGCDADLYVNVSLA